MKIFTTVIVGLFAWRAIKSKYNIEIVEFNVYNSLHESLFNQLCTVKNFQK